MQSLVSIVENAGYTRRLTSQEVKAREIEMLSVFDAFAQAEGIRYSIAYGTLLGAVRHGGFIPWDDDVDIVVPRPDYDRLVRMAVAGKAPKPYRFTGWAVDGFPMPFVKLIDPRVGVRDSANKPSIPLNLWLDVFPLDGVSTDETAYREVDRKAQLLKSIIKTDNYRFLGAGKGLGRRMAKMAVKPWVSLFGLGDKALRGIDELARLGPSYDEAAFVSNIAWGIYGLGERFPKQLMEGGDEMRFENIVCRVMPGWDEYLSSIYGAYGELPPLQERVAHGVDAWIVDYPENEEGTDGV